MTSGEGKGEPTLRLGIAGLGGGASQMVPAFVRHPHIRITAAADIDTEVLERFRHDFSAETYHSVEEMCKNPNVDAVYIATPNQFHTEHALAALERGKHVLLEKPMTLTLEDAEVIIQAAQRRGVHLLVNVKHSFEPRIQKLREMVRARELGRLRMIHNWYFNDWLYRPRTAEELDPDLGGGVVWRQGPHHFDILRTIAGGMARSVRAMTGLWDPSRPVSGCYVAYLEFQDGVAATSIYNGYDRFHSTELVYGLGDGATPARPSTYAQARKALRQAAAAGAELAAKRAGRYGGGAPAPASGRPGGGFTYILGGPEIVSFDKGDVRLTPNGLMVYGEEERREIALPPEPDGRDGSIRQLYEAVAHGRPPSADGRWGKATLEVLLAVNQSARERREVLLAHQVPARD
jgi:phthalate 4,5-cis-dihydrodiol dehydrogenase